jgi:hypothetical protein
MSPVFTIKIWPGRIEGRWPRGVLGAELLLLAKAKPDLANIFGLQNEELQRAEKNFCSIDEFRLRAWAADMACANPWAIRIEKSS